MIQEETYDYRIMIFIIDSIKYALPFFWQQSAVLLAFLLNSLQLLVPQTKPVLHSLFESQSPPPIPHLLDDEQQLQSVSPM